MPMRKSFEPLAIERLKRELVAALSHQLRTPLTSVHGALGLLAGGMLGELDPHAQKLLDIAVRSTDQLVYLINDILEVGWIRSGHAELRRSPVAASELFREGVELVREDAERSGVAIACETVDAVVLVDHDRIIQMLTSLLRNTVRTSGHGSVVRLGGVAEGGVVTFFVAGQGRGIADDELSAIFERFEKPNAAADLGLAICRCIVEAHGGRIWAESRGGAGSAFCFTVPLAAA